MNYFSEKDIYDIVANVVAQSGLGKNKAAAVKAALTGPVDPKVPASILQLHPDCTIVADEEALSLL